MTVSSMRLVKDNQTVRFEEHTHNLPPPLPDEVTLKVAYAGVCGSDIARYRGSAYHYPITIGHEFSGIADAPGQKTDGMRAVVFPVLPCHECEPCKKGLYALCENYDYYGSRRDGAFTTALNVKKENLLPVPDNVSLREAAMCEPAAVALNALRKAKNIAGRKIAVYGAGTIGLLVMSIAKALGAADCLFHDPDQKHREFAERLGFEEIGDRNDADIYVDACGHVSALTDMISRAKPCSELILLGNPAGDADIPKDVYWKILRRELTLYGTWNSRYSMPGESFRNDWKNILGLMETGKLDVKPLITHILPLSDADRALRIMTDRNEFSVKVMLDCGGETK